MTGSVVAALRKKPCFLHCVVAKSRQRTIMSCDIPIIGLVPKNLQKAWKAGYSACLAPDASVTREAGREKPLS